MGERYAEHSGYTAEAYFELMKKGVLEEDDRVELLDGVIVAEPPMDPPHASGIVRVACALRAAIGSRAVIREQMPLVVGADSVPEPDVAVLRGRIEDYDDIHPRSALLVVEVSDASLKQDRLSKSRIYAGAAVPEYWIVNLRQECVEVFRTPDAVARLYGERTTVGPGERVALLAFPDASVAVGDLLPRRSPVATDD